MQSKLILSKFRCNFYYIKSLTLNRFPFFPAYGFQHVSKKFSGRFSRKLDRIIMSAEIHIRLS